MKGDKYTPATTMMVKAAPVDHKRVAELGRAKAPEIPRVSLKKNDVKRLWDNYQVVAEVQRSTNRKFVIAACTRDGYRSITVTEFYYRKSDCTWQPNRGGILIPIKCPDFSNMTDDGLPTMMEPLNEFMKAIAKAAEVAETMELADPEHSIYLARKTNLRPVRADENNSKENQE